MQKPLVSVITPMYKGAAYIGDAVESVIGQSEKNWEMIVVDDCSPDNGAGAKIVEDYRRNDGRIRLIRLPENRGSSGARNEAMRNAHGRYFAFLDSDDIWDRNYLETILAHIKAEQNPGAAIFFTGYRRMDETCSSEILPPYSSSGIKNFKTLLFHCPIFPSAAVLDTSKLAEKVFFREGLGNLRDDYVFWLDITRRGLAAVGYDDILANCRMRPDSLTASKIKMIKPQWNVYHSVLGMNVVKSLIYFFAWALNGVKKYGWKWKKVMSTEAGNRGRGTLSPRPISP